MPPRRRGARTGRGWDAAPARPRTGDAARAGRPRRAFGDDPRIEDEFPVTADEAGWPEGAAESRPVGRRSAAPPPPEPDGPSWSTAVRPASGLPKPADLRAAADAPPSDYSGRVLPWSADANAAAARGGTRSARGSQRSGDAAATGGSGPSADASGGRGSRPERSGDRAAGPATEPGDEREMARDICIRQLAVRPRTRAELAKALAKRGISPEVTAEALDRYDEVGMIDDAAFARAWVSSRHHGKGLARRALANELRQRGVDAEVATEALETLDEASEATAARALVDRKLRTTRGTPEQVFRRLVGMLARKGYPAGVAIRAVKDALAARDAEAAEFADQIDADAMADEASELS